MKEVNILIEKIIGGFNLDDTFLPVVTEILKSYDSGVDKVGVQLNMNFTSDPNRKDLLKDYTFDLIKGLTDSTKDKLRSELQRGIMNLESITKIQKRIQKVMDVSSTRAKAIARTESVRAENMGHIDGARQSGLKLLKYVDAHLDSRTSDICRYMDIHYGNESQAIPMNQKFKFNGNVWDIPPFHINCRTTIVFTQKVKDEE